MAIMAKQKFPEIDFVKSIMVGDTESDIMFGKNAGMITVQIGQEATIVTPDFRLGSLEEFAWMFKSIS
jgi:histidinol phosphatase-like enzyme